MLAFVDIPTALRILALMLLAQEGKISRKEFEKQANITPDQHLLFEAQIEKWKDAEMRTIRAERN